MRRKPYVGIDDVKAVNNQVLDDPIRGEKEKVLHPKAKGMALGQRSPKSVPVRCHNQSGKHSDPDILWRCTNFQANKAATTAPMTPAAP